MAEISSAPVKRLLTESSGGLRVAASAIERVVAEAEIYVRAIGKAAGEMATAEHRKTILDDDIARALTSVRGGNQPQA